MLGPCLRLLAAPTLTVGSLPPMSLPPNDALLLAMLALDGALARDTLATLLWPDNPPAGARANLRQRVKRLQDNTRGHLLLSQGTQLALAPAVQHDLSDLPTALHVNPQAAAGALLGPLQIKDNPAASLWLDQARARVQALRQQVLQDHADALEQAHALEAALPYAQRLVSEDPLQENAHRRLMRLHYRRGDRGAALAVYRQLAQTLHRQLDSAPDAQTEALARLIEGAMPSLPVAAPAPVKTVPSEEPQAPSAPAAATWAALMRPPRLLQRQAEWTQLSRAWAHGGVVLVLGEAGIGKTRLLQDFADSVGVALQLKARLGDAAVPYALVARWVSALLPQAQALPAWARGELARLLPSLGQPAEGPLSTLHLCQALALLTEPLGAVLLDDLHFADAASLELLPSVLQPVRFCLLASRTAELPTALQAWLQQAGHHVTLLPLLPWQQDTVLALLRGAVVPADLSAAWAPVLWRHTGGHPLLVLETLRAVLLAQPEGAALGAPPAVLPMPPKVLQLVRLRLAGLPALSQLIAQVASLAGDAFGPELAAAGAAQPVEALAGAWQALQDAALMSPQGSVHDLVLEAARSTLAAPLAQVLHARIAEHLATRGCPPAQLALHWAAAAQPARAAQCHEQAAQRAASMSRGTEQAVQWAQAAACWQQAGDAPRAFAAAANEAGRLVLNGDPDASLQRCEALLKVASSPRDVAQVRRVQTMALAYSRRWDDAIQAATQGAQAARLIGHDTWLADCLLLKANMAAMLGQREVAEQCLAETSGLVVEHDDHHHRVTHQGLRGSALTYLGHLEEALAINEACITLSDHPATRGLHLVEVNNSVVILNRLGRQQQALARARQAVQLAVLQDEDKGVVGGQARMHLGLFAALNGRYGEAMAEMKRGADLLAALKLPQVDAVVHNHLIGLWTQLGQPERALQLLQADASQLPAPLHLRRWVLRADLHRVCGTQAPGPAPVDLSESADAAVNASARLAMARVLPASERVQTLQALAGEFQAQSWMASKLSAQFLQLQSLTDLHPAAAGTLALQLLTDLQTTTPSTGYWPEAMWEVHLALRASGHEAQAQSALQAARTWVETARVQHVPDELRASFMQRNRTNLAIERAWRAGSGQ